MLESRENFMFQIDSFRVKRSKGAGFEELPVPSRYDRLAGRLQAGPAYNVAQMYAQIYDDLTTGGRRAPDFRTALETHESLDRFRAAAAKAARQTV